MQIGSFILLYKAYVLKANGFMWYPIIFLVPKRSQPPNNVHGKRSALVDGPSRNTGIKGILKTANLRHSELKASGPNRRLLRSKSPTNTEMINSRVSAKMSKSIRKRVNETCKQCNCAECRLQNNTQKIGENQNLAYSCRHAGYTPRPRSADSSDIRQSYTITPAKHYQHLNDSGGPYSQTFSNSLIYDETQPIPQRNACLLYTSPSPRDATLSRMPSSA